MDGKYAILVIAGGLDGMSAALTTVITSEEYERLSAGGPIGDAVVLGVEDLKAMVPPTPDEFERDAGKWRLEAPDPLQDERVQARKERNHGSAKLVSRHNQQFGHGGISRLDYKRSKSFAYTRKGR